ncbi:hypothetical protein AAIG28_08585 [Citrobacter freundii]|uniref:hypothetical protein n=1 Tax=Citrobacter freundii TaxID=546 RepID=UPI0015C487D9|nr:hypothetical protein [Citrobacter freundii]NWO36309.1 hypothetical protein [Citrobacter freundii]HDG1657277.1 hypothetical protein [Citrobacter freundii]
MTLFMSNTVQPLDNPIVIQPSLISGGDNHYQAHQEMSFVMKSRCESGSLGDELNFEPVTQLSLPSA